MFFLILDTLGLGYATGLKSLIIAVVCDTNPRRNRTVTGVICVIHFLVGLFYVTPGGQAALTSVYFFGRGFIIFVLTIIEVATVS